MLVTPCAKGPRAAKRVRACGARMAAHKLHHQPPLSTLRTLRTLHTPRTPHITRTATASAASPHPRLRMLQRAVPVGVDGSGRGARTVPRGGPACLAATPPAVARCRSDRDCHRVWPGTCRAWTRWAFQGACTRGPACSASAGSATRPLAQEARSFIERRPATPHLAHAQVSPSKAKQAA